MRKLSRIAAFAAALAVTAPSLPSFAQQPTKAQQQEAATRFKKGLELFKDGDYQAALIEFRRANELAPNYNVLYNIGQVYFQLQDYPGALNALERYLNEGGNSIPASRRAEVQRDIDKLKARVANLEITSAVPDAEIAIDDVVIGKSPLNKPIMVSAGKHKVTISKQGFTPVTRVVEIASAESQKVHLDPVEQKSATPVPVEPPKPPPEQTVTPPNPDANKPPEPPPPPPQRSVPVAGIVTTSAFTVGAVVMGILALGASSSLQEEVKNPSATRDSLDSAKTKTVAFALVTDVLTGAAVVSAGITLYVGLSGPSKKDAPAGQPAASAPRVRVGVTPNGVKILGTF
jgi:hypothetical protein